MPSQGNQQKRVLGLCSATSTVICNMIGAGIFMTTGLFAAELGSGTAIMAVWLVAGVLALCGSLCAIELANIWPEAGGNYVFIRNIFGRPAGFVAGFSIAFFGITGSMAIIGGIYPNVDFYSGLVYRKLGIPRDLFTPVFAISRVEIGRAHV